MRSAIKAALGGLMATGAALVLVGMLNGGPPARSPRAVARPSVPAVRPSPASSSRVISDPTARPVQQPVRPSADPPLFVSIPSLSAGGPVVERVSVQLSGPERGLLGAPADFHDLGWFINGSAGVLVIDGHVGFAAGAGPLAYIGELTPGARVLVRFRTGTRTFDVSAVRSVPKGRLPAGYFGARYDGQLMLITCDYLSPFHDGHFADNVFVIASPER